MLLLGIPETWYKSSHFNSGNLLMDLIYYSLLLILFVLVIFAFTFAHYLRRKEISSAKFNCCEQQANGCNTSAGKLYLSWLPCLAGARCKHQADNVDQEPNASPYHEQQQQQQQQQLERQPRIRPLQRHPAYSESLELSQQQAPSALQPTCCPDQVQTEFYQTMQLRPHNRRHHHHHHHHRHHHHRHRSQEQQYSSFNGQYPDHCHCTIPIHTRRLMSRGAQAHLMSQYAPPPPELIVKGLYCGGGGSQNSNDFNSNTHLIKAKSCNGDEAFMGGGQAERRGRHRRRLELNGSSESNLCERQLATRDDSVVEYGRKLERMNSDGSGHLKYDDCDDLMAISSACRCSRPENSGSLAKFFS